VKNEIVVYSETAEVGMMIVVTIPITLVDTDSGEVKAQAWL
jgi:hypothetical protein